MIKKNWKDHTHVYEKKNIFTREENIHNYFVYAHTETFQPFRLLYDTKFENSVGLMLFELIENLCLFQSCIRLWICFNVFTHVFYDACSMLQRHKSFI